MRPERIVFCGNCQALGLSGIYGRAIAPGRGQAVACVDIGERSTEAGRRALAEADVLVLQKFSFDYDVDAALLKPGIRILSYPTLSNGFLWPYANQQAHPRNMPVPGFREGPYPPEISDSFLNRMIKAGIPREDAVRRYLDLDIAKEAQLDRLFEITMERQRTRDAATGFSIAPRIEAEFRTRRLFLTPGHPDLPLFRTLASEVFTMLGASETSIATALRPLRTSPFPRDELPIHPGVASHFDLAFVGEDSRYSLHGEGTFTFTEYARRYYDCAVNRELAEGIMLAGAAGADPAEALALLERGLKASPASPQGWLTKSRVLLRLGQAEAARDAALRAVDAAPEDPEGPAALSRALRAAGDRDGAVGAARRAVALFPEAGEPHRWLAEALSEAGRPAEAVQALRAAMEQELVVPNPNELADLGHHLLREGDLDGAERALRQAVEGAPDQARMRALLAQVLERRGEVEAAIGVLRQAVALEGDSPNPHILNHLGHLLQRQGEAEEAEAAFRQAVRIAPDAAGFRGALAHALDRLGRREEAITELGRAVALEGDSPNPHIHSYLGHLLLHSGDPAGAEQPYRTAVERAPDLAVFRGGLAEVLLRLGRREEAIAELRQAVALEAEAPNPHRLGQLGELLVQQGDAAEAESVLRQAAALLPEADGIRGALAVALDRLGRPEEAAAELRLVVARAGGHPNPHVVGHLGSLLGRLGDAAGAEEALRLATALAPEIPYFRVRLVDALRRSGAMEEARAEVEQGLRQTPDDAELLAWRDALALPPVPAAPAPPSNPAADGAVIATGEMDGEDGGDVPGPTHAVAADAASGHEASAPAHAAAAAAGLGGGADAAPSPEAAPVARTAEPPGSGAPPGADAIGEAAVQTPAEAARPDMPVADPAPLAASHDSAGALPAASVSAGAYAADELPPLGPAAGMEFAHAAGREEPVARAAARRNTPDTSLRDAAEEAPVAAPRPAPIPVRASAPSRPAGTPGPVPAAPPARSGLGGALRRMFGRGRDT